MDAQLEMVANAILRHYRIAVTAAAGAFCAPRHSLLAAPIILWLALPYAQENTLWVFNRAFIHADLLPRRDLGIEFSSAFFSPCAMRDERHPGLSQHGVGFWPRPLCLLSLEFAPLGKAPGPPSKTVTAVVAGWLCAGIFLRHEVPHHAALKAVRRCLGQRVWAVARLAFL